MNLTLTRNKFRPDGVFSTLTNDLGEVVAFTLEHSYDNLPKLQPGAYTCVRGQHQLHHMTAPFETFEIKGVIGHSNILFHWGNYNADSDGCVLLGEKVVPAAKAANAALMVTNSKVTFAKFMELQQGVDSFTLSVVRNDS